MQADRILHYRIEQHLGSGSFGDVYLAHDEKLDRHVALKMAAPGDDEAQKKEVAARFELEIGATVKLVHPHIVTVYDAGVTDECLFYVMAYLPGGDLKQNNNSLISNSAIAQVIIDIAAALAYAHDMGFVHRDIKPENILFDTHGNAVLADFGIVKAIGKEYTMGRHIMGSPSYSAPEQLDADEEIDGRADLYSLGKVLYFMLTKHKYSTDDTGTLPPERALFQRAMDKLLSNNKEDRFQSAQEVINEFEALQMDIKHNAADNASTKTQQPRQSGIPKMTLAMVVGLVVVVVGIGFLLLNQINRSVVQPAQPSQLTQAELPIRSASTVTDSDAAPVVSVAQLDSAIAADTSEDLSSSAPVAIAEDAIVSITTKPEGAEVLLDGAVLGTTPFLSESMPIGEQTLTIQKRFYQPQLLTMVLESKKIAKRDIRLMLGHGSLSIITDPAGARVWIDGQSITGATPLSVDEITAGPQVIDIRKGNISRRMAIEVEHGQVTLLRAALNDANGSPEISQLPAATLAGLAVNSNPPGAEVFIDGAKVGSTPFKSNTVAAGIHQVKLTHKFYATSVFETELGPDAPVNRFIELKPGYGDLSVITEPMGAMVFLDDKRLKEHTPLSLSQLPTGHHHIDIRKGNLRLQQEIEITNGAATVVEGELKAGTLIEIDGFWLTADELMQLAKLSNKDTQKLKYYQAILHDNPKHAAALAGLNELKVSVLSLFDHLLDGHQYEKARKLAVVIRENFSDYVVLPDLDTTITQHQHAHELADLKAGFAKQDKRIRLMLGAKHFVEAEQLLRQIPQSAQSLDAYRALSQSFKQQRVAFQQQVIKHTGALALVKVDEAKYLRAFAHEVTFSQWDSCVKDGMCRHKPNDHHWGRGQRPVINVSYDDITREFIPWINRKTGLTFKLPTEAEWQVLYGNTGPVDAHNANGPEGFDWGNDGAEHTADVGSYQKNINGLYDLAGNVWEWVEQCADEHCARRMLKGGSWNSAPKFLAREERWPEFPTKRSNDIGFRLVADYDWMGR